MFLKSIFPLFFSVALLLTSCGDDDRGLHQEAPTGSFEVEDQPIVNGRVEVNNVAVSHDSWIVIYRDNAGDPGTEILGHAMVFSGSHEKITIILDQNANITIGETLWAALHVDDDGDGVFDWDGTTGVDGAIKMGLVNVSESFTIRRANTLIVRDQPVTDNKIIISRVTLNDAGWVVLNEYINGFTGDPISESLLLEAGVHEDVEILLYEDVNLAPGDFVIVSLFTDTGLPIRDENGEEIIEIINITEE